MRSRSLCGVALACAFVSCSARAGDGPPPVALTASPARIALGGGTRREIRVTNTGRSDVSIDAATAGFALDLLGRPGMVPLPNPSWLEVRPRRIALRAGESALVSVAASIPRRAAPGDHDELVLLTSRPLAVAGVAVRMRVGVLVDVRVPGKVVHRLELRSLGVRRKGDARALALLIANRGNVTEQLSRSDVVVSIRDGWREIARLRVGPRELLPHASALLAFRYDGRARGAFTAVVDVLGTREHRPAVRRAFRLRL